MEQQEIERNNFSSSATDFFEPVSQIEETEDYLTRTQSIHDYLSQGLETRVNYDFSISDSFYEIDVEGLSRHFNENDLLLDILRDLSPTDGTAQELSAFLSDDQEAAAPTESDDGDRPIQSNDARLAMIKLNDTTLPAIRSRAEKISNKSVSDQTSITLSNSVLVTVAPPNQLQIVNALEETYRPRYKSDYFPQKGQPRSPRYVADNHGNHYVTIQIPKNYQSDLSSKFIRVALVTTLLPERGHFYSPYKFQLDNNDINVPDQNPIYKSVTDNEISDYKVKLQLVLIKSKLDQLNSAQPLQPFSYPNGGQSSNATQEKKLTPKDLINRYQLDKSQLAFTLCTKLANGSYECHSETTVLSTVIVESPMKSSNGVVTSSESSTSEIRCPHCSQCFALRDAQIVETGKKRKLNKSSTETKATRRVEKKQK